MLSATPFATPRPVDVGTLPAPGEFSLVLASSPVLAEFETRLLLETVARGEDVALVCGNNRLDAYGLLARARAVGLEDALADGVHLARAFTVHQFLALLEETLPYMTRTCGARAVLVTGVLEPFADEDVTDQEALVLVPRTMRRLAAFAAQAGLPVVATGDPRSRLAPLACEHAPYREVFALVTVPRQPNLESFLGVEA